MMCRAMVTMEASLRFSGLRLYCYSLTDNSLIEVYTVKNLLIGCLGTGDSLHMFLPHAQYMQQAC